MTALLQRLARAPFRAWGVIAAAVLMTLLLGQIVAERIAILADGEEVILATQPIDPRDLFRGDYVILTYGISRLPLDRLADDPEAYEEGNTVFVALEKDAEGRGTATAIAGSRDALPSDALVIKGRIEWIDRAPLTVTASRVGEGEPARDIEPCPRCRNARIAYGIESYFVPEGERVALEEARNEATLEIITAINEAGTAAIKGIILDGGEPAYVEPLI